MSNEAASPVAQDNPLMIAWKDYQQTKNFQNSKRWAMRISPMVHAGDPDADAKRERDLMPREERERYVEGSLWAAFMAGFKAAKSQ